MNLTVRLLAPPNQSTAPMEVCTLPPVLVRVYTTADTILAAGTPRYNWFRLLGLWAFNWWADVPKPETLRVCARTRHPDPSSRAAQSLHRHRFLVKGSWDFVI